MEGVSILTISSDVGSSPSRNFFLERKASRLVRRTLMGVPPARSVNACWSSVLLTLVVPKSSTPIVTVRGKFMSASRALPPSFSNRDWKCFMS